MAISLLQELICGNKGKLLIKSDTVFFRRYLEFCGVCLFPNFLGICFYSNGQFMIQGHFGMHFHRSGGRGFQENPKSTNTFGSNAFLVYGRTL